MDAAGPGTGILSAHSTNLSQKDCESRIGEANDAAREADPARGGKMMVTLFDASGDGVPKPLSELITLGCTLKKRAVDVLAYFDRPGASNGPTEGHL